MAIIYAHSADNANIRDTLNAACNIEHNSNVWECILMDNDNERINCHIRVMSLAPEVNVVTATYNADGIQFDYIYAIYLHRHDGELEILTDAMFISFFANAEADTLEDWVNKYE